jgi:hypothetical protein
MRRYIARHESGGARPFRWLRDLWPDVRHALRQLRRDPAAVLRVD